MHVIDLMNQQEFSVGSQRYVWRFQHLTIICTLFLIIAFQPSICVRANPIYFKVSEDAKENSGGLPYRIVFAVLTWDHVIIYDTVQEYPISVVTGIHYAHIVDASWTSDGHTLAVCSTDGFISFLRFEQGELGEVFEREDQSISESPAVASKKSPPLMTALPPCDPALPPCDPGAVSVEARPNKKIKTSDMPDKRQLEHPDSKSAKKKKKRIQPTLVMGATQS